jgi:hypothetical protein
MRFALLKRKITNLGASPKGMSWWFGKKTLLKIRDSPTAIGTGIEP